MEDTASAGGRSASTDVVSNASSAIPPESDASPRDGSDVEIHEQAEDSEQDLRGLDEQEKAGSSLSEELSAGEKPQEQRGEISNDESRASPQEQRIASSQEQRLESPQGQRGASLQGQRFGSPQDQRFASPQDQRGASLHDQRGASLHDQRGASLPDQRGASLPDQRGTSLPDQRGASLPENRGASPQEHIAASTQDQRGASAQDQRAASPQDHILASPQDQRLAPPQDQRLASPQDQRDASPQDQRLVSPQDQISDKSPDVSTDVRPPTQESLTDADRDKQSEQGGMIHDVVSARHSPVERLITSRQSQFEDAFSEKTETKDVDVESADEASLSTTDSQGYPNTGSLGECCCQQPREQAKDETDTDNRHVGATATPTLLGTAESQASLARVNDSRVSNQSEPNLEVGDSLYSSQYNNEKPEAKENEVLGQCCQQEIAEETFGAQSAEEENHLKAEITSLQIRLNTLIKDNNEKGMRIVALESNLLEMTAKLLSVEKKCAPFEVSPSKRETNKSRTCAIL